MLVIWPDANDADLRFKNNDLSLACQHLKNPDIPDSTKAEGIDYMLRQAPNNIPAVSKAVSDYAIEKRNLPLWYRCVQACGRKNGLMWFKLDMLDKANATFGFQDIKQRYPSQNITRDKLILHFIPLALTFFSEEKLVIDHDITC